MPIEVNNNMAKTTLVLATLMAALVVGASTVAADETQTGSQDASVDVVLTGCGDIDISEYFNTEVCLKNGKVEISGGPTVKVRESEQFGDLEENGYQGTASLNLSGGITTIVDVRDFDLNETIVTGFLETSAVANLQIEEIGSAKARLFGRASFDQSGLNIDTGIKINKSF